MTWLELDNQCWCPDSWSRTSGRGGVFLLFAGTLLAGGAETWQHDRWASSEALMREWSVYPPSLLVLHTFLQPHSCEGGRSRGGREVGEREAGLSWTSDRRQSCHNRRLDLLRCGLTAGDPVGRTERHAGPGGQSPQKGDGDRVSPAVQESGWDRGRGGGGATGGRGEFWLQLLRLLLKALWGFFFQAMGNTRSRARLSRELNADLFLESKALVWSCFVPSCATESPSLTRWIRLFCLIGDKVTKCGEICTFNAWSDAYPSSQSYQMFCSENILWMTLSYY